MNITLDTFPEIVPGTVGDCWGDDCLSKELRFSHGLGSDVEKVRAKPAAGMRHPVVAIRKHFVTRKAQPQGISNLPSNLLDMLLQQIVNYAAARQAAL